MTKREQLLLKNVLDSLDRLYDGDSLPIDVYALIVATSEALKGSEFSVMAESIVPRLKEIAWSAMTAENKKHQMLFVTSELRHFLARVTPFP